MNYIKHSAITFLHQNHLFYKEVTFKKLLTVARKNGYIIKKYSSSGSLMILLNIYDRAKKSSSVSLIDENSNTYIFLDDKLPASKQLFALAHEIGHIKLEHSASSDKSRRQEREANLFAHYILDTAPQKLDTAIKFLTGFLCLCITVTTVFYANKTSTKPLKDNNSVIKIENDTICYFTEYGSVYHLYRDCSYLNNSKKVYTSTIGKCTKKTLCSRCEDKNS